MLDREKIYSLKDGLKKIYTWILEKIQNATKNNNYSLI